MQTLFSRFATFPTILAALTIGAFAQRPVDLKNQNERVVMVVPLTGVGTYSDPKRPLLAPTSAKALQSAGILSYQWHPSDDGKYAIVEYAARTRGPLVAMLRDTRLIVAFEKGTREEIRPGECDSQVQERLRD